MSHLFKNSKAFLAVGAMVSGTSVVRGKVLTGGSVAGKVLTGGSVLGGMVLIGA